MFELNNELEQQILSLWMTNMDFHGSTLQFLNPKIFTGERSEIFKMAKEFEVKHGHPPSVADFKVQLSDYPNKDRAAVLAAELVKIRDVAKPQDIKAFEEATVKYTKARISEDAALKIAELTASRKDATPVFLKAIEDIAMVGIEEDQGLTFFDPRQRAYYLNAVAGILTQHPILNERLGRGITDGTLSFVLAPPGIGKSLFMTDLAKGLLLQGKNVLIISLEMSDNEIMKRIHSNILDIPIAELDPDKLDPNFYDRKLADMQKLRDQGKLGEVVVRAFPSGSFGSLQLKSMIQQYKRTMDLEFDMVFVDYLGIMKSDRMHNHDNFYGYIKSIGEELRAVAVELKLPIFTASQLNRGAINNLDADNSNISDSMGTAMTADFMMFLTQDEAMKAEGIVNCKVTKNRYNGRTDHFQMKVDYRFMRYMDPNSEEAAAVAEVFVEAGKTETQFAKDLVENWTVGLEKTDSPSEEIGVEWDGLEASAAPTDPYEEMFK